MSVQIITAKRNKMPAPLLRNMYRLRYKVFCQRLKWEVQDFGELEIDEFDYRNPEYIIAKDQIENVVGCWRLIPTTEKYMLEEVFSFLLGDMPLPKDENIWELSRFAVVDSHTNDQKLSLASILMIKQVIDFALKNNITSYLAVTSIGVERLLKSVGIPMKRIGLKKSVYIGNVKSVLCSIPIDQKLLNDITNLLNKYEPEDMAA